MDQRRNWIARGAMVDNAMPQSPLIDRFGRQITYLRLSVTDRCDLRCRYCMSEQVRFLPKRDVLTLEELEAIADAFIARGVRKIRITGGEPLLRKDIATLMARLGRKRRDGLIDELTLTTNATQLAAHAARLREIGVERINISLDTMDDALFARLTRRNALSDVLRGVDAAQSAGLAVKINIVALKGVNEDEIPALIEWAHGRAMAASLIEVMPLGEVDEARVDQYLPLSAVRERLAQRWTLTPLSMRTGGPARYCRVEETGGVVGFITPLTGNFCDGCNRVRVTCTGRIYMCLGQDAYVDLRAPLRGAAPQRALDAALDRAMIAKPERHEFAIDDTDRAPAVARPMSMTGG